MVGIPIAAYIDVRHDPPPRYDSPSYRKSPAEFGFEVAMTCLLWPIVPPFVIVYYALLGLGRLLGNR